MLDQRLGCTRGARVHREAKCLPGSLLADPRGREIPGTPEAVPTEELTRESGEEDPGQNWPPNRDTRRPRRVRDSYVSKQVREHAGCPSNGPGPMKRRRKRYRSRRRQRPSRTRRIMKTQAPVWLSIVGLLCGLQPATSLPWGKGGKWYNLTSPIRRAADERGETYWAVARGVPSLRIMGWGSQTVPLKLHGNATVVLGLHEHGTLPIPMERPLKKPLTLPSRPPFASIHTYGTLLHGHPKTRPAWAT
ncbi:uncharacterized protein LOC141512224 [Macrotis lagotis]|uniref:uncharacterized protein LOC141512224 n=1 Tax=Macrotis lagotis TaxID=92651 RepID=UPI003D69CFD2